MHRVSMRAAVGVLAVAALTLAACGSKDAGTTAASSSTSSSTSSSSSAGSEPASSESGSETSEAPSGGALTITPLQSVDGDGKPIEAAAATSAVDPAGDGSATCADVSIATTGPLTGANAALGQNILGGVKLALKVHNDANPNCQVELKEFDTEGNPDKAVSVAPSIISDNTVIAQVGPAFSGETNATMDTFFQANLASLTPSATRVDLTTNGWTNFFRGLYTDGVQGKAAAGYLSGELAYKKICVVSDNTDYGIGLAEVVNTTLAGVADASCANQVKTGDKDFSAAVNSLKTAAPDAIYYAGYYAEAAPFVKQLRDSGVTATFVSADGTNDPQFVAQAGDSAKGALLSCPCGPAPEQFSTDFEALNGIAPGVYSVEGYDLTTIILTGIDSGITERSAMVDYVKNYDADGLARTYKWDETGELSGALIWMYEVK